MDFREKNKFVETIGPTVSNNLCSHNPMKAPCQREDCWPCLSRKAGEFVKKGLVYKISCQTCQEAGKKSYYIGETSRSSYDRGIEHLMTLQKGNRGSPLTEHHKDFHPRLEPKLKLEVEGYYRQPLYRHTREGQLIADDQEGALLNKKGEWGQNLPPTLDIVVEDKVEIRKLDHTESERNPSQRNQKSQRVSEV